MISVVSAATRIACKQMTFQHLDALQASLEQASGLLSRGLTGGARPPLMPKLFNVLGALDRLTAIWRCW